MCEGPCQKESIERKKEMVKVPWLQVQEKMRMSTAKDASPADQNEEGINAIEQNVTICRKNERGCEKQNSPRMKCGSVETRTVIECKKMMTRYWIVMPMLACHTIGRAALNMRGACESCRMIKLTERVNDDLIRKNDAAINELVARQNDATLVELVPLGDLQLYGDA